MFYGYASYFMYTEWTTDGCETDLPEVNEGVVTCNCSHLTNFAVLSTCAFIVHMHLVIHTIMWLFTPSLFLLLSHIHTILPHRFCSKCHLQSRDHRAPLLAQHSCWHQLHPPVSQHHHQYQQNLQSVWRVGESGPHSLYLIWLHQHCEFQYGFQHRLPMWCTWSNNALHLQANITPDNYEEVLTNVSGAVRGAATSEQTRSSLAMVADAFQRTAALINETTIITNTVSSFVWTIGLLNCLSPTSYPCLLPQTSTDSDQLGQHIEGPATVESGCATS